MPLICLLLLLLTGCTTSYAERPEVAAFIEHIAQKHHWKEEHLKHVFNQVHEETRLFEKTTRASEKTLTWDRYREAFLTSQRIEAGRLFLNQHRNILIAAEHRFGVPKEIIVAILGVETNYGEKQGQFNVLNTLSTLSFSHSHRMHYFQSELEHYLLLTQEHGFDPVSMNGSYAGAIGQPQFMPSSYRSYAIDAQHKGYADLIHNTNDSIMSIAHYLQSKGWRQGQPIAMRIPRYRPLPILEPIHPKKTIRKPQHKLPPNTSITLEINGYKQIWLIFHNFHVIMQYNDSRFYAMAVYQLSQAVSDHLSH